MSTDANMSYRVSVSSAGEYERLIAEVLFANGVGLIISEERAIGQYDISVHTPRSTSLDDLSDGRNVAHVKVPLSAFRRGLDEAVGRLTLLGPERS